MPEDAVSAVRCVIRDASIALQSASTKTITPTHRLLMNRPVLPAYP